MSAEQQLRDILHEYINNAVFPRGSYEHAARITAMLNDLRDDNVVYHVIPVSGKDSYAIRIKPRFVCAYIDCQGPAHWKVSRHTDAWKVSASMDVDYYCHEHISEYIDDLSENIQTITLERVAP